MYMYNENCAHMHYLLLSDAGFICDTEERKRRVTNVMVKKVKMF